MLVIGFNFTCFYIAGLINNIVFWTRNVILPSLDSICKSLNHETNNINIK